MSYKRRLTLSDLNLQGSNLIEHLTELFCRSRSYDDEGELPEWSMADTDDMEGLGTFDSSGAFMSMKVMSHYNNAVRINWSQLDGTGMYDLYHDISTEIKSNYAVCRRGSLVHV